MWNEIQTHSKIELLHVLFMTKLTMEDECSIASMDEISPDTFSKMKSPSKAALERWNFIIDMYIKNGFF